MRKSQKKNSLVFKFVIVCAIFTVILAPNGVTSSEEEDDVLISADFPASVVLCWWWKLNPSIRLVYPQQHEFYEPGTEVKCMIHIRSFRGHRELSAKYYWSNEEERPDFDSVGIDWSKPWKTNIPDYLEDGDVYLHIKATDSWGFRKYKTYHFKVDTTAPEITLISPDEGMQYEPGTLIDISIDDGNGIGIDKAKFLWSEFVETPDWELEGNTWEEPYDTSIPSGLKSGENYLHTYAIDYLGFNTSKTFTFNTETNMLPVADFDSDKNSIIAGQAVSFSFTGNEGDEPASYEWDFGDLTPLSTEKNPIHTYSAPGIYSVRLTVADIDGDIDSVEKINLIDVVPDLLPNAQFLCLNSSIIAGQIAEFEFAGDKGNEPSEFQWSFGDNSQNSTEENPIHQYTAPGTYDVILTISDPDGDVATVINFGCIDVIPDASPLAAFMAENIKIIAGQSVAFSFTEYEGNAPASFEWDFGDTSPISTEKHPSHLYGSAGNYTVTLKVTDFDGDIHEISIIDYIEVLPDLTPIADFTSDMTSSIAGQVVSFQFTGSEGNDPATFVWDFGDGTGDVIGINPTHVFSSEGIYTVTLTVTDLNGDVDSVEKIDYITATINYPVAAEFDTIIQKQIAGIPIYFEFLGWLGNEPTSFTWDFGDGSELSSEMSPTHIYQTPGFYTVKLTVMDIDGDTDDMEKVDYIEIVADEIPIADFEANLIEVYNKVGVGQEILFEFTGFEGNAPAQFKWDFGDATAFSTLRDPIHTYSRTGIYDVTLTVTDFNGDVDVMHKIAYVEVIANLIPTASITVNTTSTYVDRFVQFNYTGFEGNAPVTFEWDFGDGSISTERDPIHAYSAEGTFFIILTVTDANGDTAVDSIEITITKIPGQTNPAIVGGIVALSIGGVVGVAGISTKATKKWKVGKKERILDKIEPTKEARKKGEPTKKVKKKVEPTKKVEKKVEPTKEAEKKVEPTKKVEKKVESSKEDAK